MRVARYIGGGEIAIVEEQAPSLPEGGLLVQAEACGLCSGELMDWYMDRKVPHVLGHEVAGKVVESENTHFPVGSRIFPHHHAPCMSCEQCARGSYVHCAQWKGTHLAPGGMAERFAVARENLTDALVVDDLRSVDAALIEPLACVVKSLRSADVAPSGTEDGDGGAARSCAVVGLGVMGLMHMRLLGGSATGYDVNERRLDWGRGLGMDARPIEDAQPADVVFVCPGNKPALDFAISIARPAATIVLFAPMPPGEETPVDLNSIYFRDLRLVSSYSCGPNDTAAAAEAIRAGALRAEQVVSHFIEIDELPKAYQAMKRGEILKPMVMFA